MRLALVFVLPQFAEDVAVHILLERYAELRVDQNRPAIPYPTPVFGGVEELWLEVQ